MKRNATIKRYTVFARNYVIDYNATRSALAAGYKKEFAASQGSRLSKHRKVKKLIDQFEAERADRTNTTADRVLEELKRLGYSNLHDYTTIDDEGQMDINLGACNRDQLAALQEFTVDTTGGTGDGERRVVLRTKIKLADKLKALELLARHLKMLTDKQEVVTTIRDLTDEEVDQRLEKVIATVVK